MKSLTNVLFALALAVFSTVTFAQAIDINSATAEQMEKALKGIGPKKAAAIVKYREANGPFASVDDLSKVPGVKGKTLDTIKPMVTVGGAAAAAPAMPKVSAPAVPSVAAPMAPAVPDALKKSIAPAASSGAVSKP